MQVTITHDDGSTDTIPHTLGWTRKREIGHMRRVTIDVERSHAQDADLEPKSDTVELGDIDTLRLVDVETGGPVWTLVCYSFEWDANQVEPTRGGDLREGTDQALVTELVGEVSSWDAGTIENHTGGLSFVFNHAHRHEALRRIERNVPGELQWRDSGTVDYVENLGSDKTASVTLSASEGNLEDEIQITNRGRELDGTHIRVLGAHEGEAQLFANLVPDDDPATYENRVDYSTDRWEPGDPRDWDRWENKDVADQDTIDEEAAAIGEEIVEELVEAEATVSGVDLDVGDWVRVVKSDAELDRDMRVHRIKTVKEGAKQVDKVLLSTRTTVRHGEGRALEDVQRFNTGFQGSSVVVPYGPVIGALDDGDPFTVPIRYPDINFENVAELHVRGLKYRVDSNPAEHSHSVTIPNHQHSVTIGDHTHSFDWQHSHNVTFESPFHTHSVIQFELNEETSEEDGHTHIYDKSNATGGPTSREEDTETTTAGGTNDDTTASGGGTTETTSSGGGTTETTDSEAGFVPGIYETNDTPTNVDVLIDNTPIATDIGSGEFETVIDVSGEFNFNEWQDLTFESDTLGRIEWVLFIEGYDQIGATNS